MRILELNSLAVGSTGQIMLSIADAAREKGYEVLCAVPNSRTNKRIKHGNLLLFGSSLLRNLGVKLSYYTGLSGFFSVFNTILLLYKIGRFKPNIVHFHNLHQDYINLPILFSHLRRKNSKVVWTLHDCWAFTGGCPHFIYVNCEKWKAGCQECPIYDQYPESWRDNSKTMYKIKKALFPSIKQLTIVTPSHWLAECVSHSYLGDKDIRVISNGVNVELYTPCLRSQAIANLLKINDVSSKHDYYKTLLSDINKGNKFVIMAVASVWNNDKGLSDYISLNSRLTSDDVLIMVGVDEELSKTLPKSIVCIPPIRNADEMVSMYNIADVILSLSKAETFGLTIAESMACGKPAIVYNNTAQKELVSNDSGFLVNDGDIEGVLSAVKRIKGFSPKEIEVMSRNCRKRAETLYDSRILFNKYIELYESICTV